MRKDRAELFPHRQRSLSAKQVYCRVLFFSGAIVMSVALYLIVFGLLKKPHTVGLYEKMLEVKINHFVANEAPRLLLIGGSNVRSSHFAKVFENELGIPVTNGGLTAELSPILMFDIWKDFLKAGDIVYIPLEFELYSRESRGVAKDYEFISTYGRHFLKTLPWQEKIRALFEFELKDVFSSVAEMLTPNLKAKNSLRENLSLRGDQMGYTFEASQEFRTIVDDTSISSGPKAEDLDGQRPMVQALKEFLSWCQENEIHVIGGLPVDFKGTNIDSSWLQEIKEIYKSQNASFLILDNQSQYPKHFFFDGRYHLIDQNAIMHSRLVSNEIKKLIETDRVKAAARTIKQ